MSTRGVLELVLTVLLCVAVTDARAYFLDSSGKFIVRLRAYSQLAVMTDSSEAARFERDTYNYRSGDLASQRNFYNPEFDARLTDYLGWARDVPGLSLIAPDDFKFRFAWWGFYDGLYDYMDGGWNDNRRALKGRFAQSDHPERFLLQQNGKINFGKTESFGFNDENKNPRHIYASRNRINEFYVDYTKDRFFFRFGRQAISWGEADTIALLDVSNPFDLTQGAPGFFQDVDEARIPLWTGRATVRLIDNWAWLSGLFVDGYLVPGIIDTTVPINPITGGVTPYGPDAGDPINQLILYNQLTGKVVVNAIPIQHIDVVDRLPESNWHNSRWGVRFTGVVDREYTVQTWFFRTFNQAPVPNLLMPPLDSQGNDLRKPVQVDNRGFRVPVCNGAQTGSFGRTPSGRPCKLATSTVTVLERQLESVFGLAATWFSQPLNGIVRTEMEYFFDELAFIPEQNLNPRSQLPAAFRAAVGDTKPQTTSVPTADYLRFLIGYDRFFFFRPLNPSNSFVVSMAFNGQLNTSARRGQDYRNPNPKPANTIKDLPVEPRPIPGVSGCRGAAAYGNPLCVKIDPHNFEDQYKFEGFFQTAFQTDYLHGRLQPRMVIITDVSGIFGFQLANQFRFTDNLLGSITYLAIEGSRRAGLATFRGHDMVQMRLTYQLN